MDRQACCWLRAAVCPAWELFVLLNTYRPTHFPVPGTSRANTSWGGGGCPLTDSHGCGVVVSSLSHSGITWNTPGCRPGHGFIKALRALGKAGAASGRSGWAAGAPLSVISHLSGEGITLFPWVWGFKLSGLGTDLACSSGQGPILAERPWQLWVDTP